MATDRNTGWAPKEKKFRDDAFGAMDSYTSDDYQATPDDDKMWKSANSIKKDSSAPTRGAVPAAAGEYKMKDVQVVDHVSLNKQKSSYKYSEGMIKLNDGSTVELTESDARALNEFYRGRDFASKTIDLAHKSLTEFHAIAELAGVIED